MQTVAEHLRRVVGDDNRRMARALFLDLANRCSLIDGISPTGEPWRVALLRAFDTERTSSR